MKKIKKLKFGLSASIGIIVLVSVIAILGIAKAYYGDAPKVIVEGNYIEAQGVEPAAQPVDERLGALTSPDISSNYLCVNGDCTYYIHASFQDASTTIVSFPDPYRIATTTNGGGVVIGMYNDASGYTGATSTIDMATLNITTAATSTYGITCGAATGPNAAATNEILTTGAQAVATGTIALIENNFDGDTVGVTGGSVAKIQLTPKYPWFNCIVATTGYDSTFTSAANSFDGTFAVRLNRPR